MGQLRSFMRRRLEVADLLPHPLLPKVWCPCPRRALVGSQPKISYEPIANNLTYVFEFAR